MQWCFHHSVVYNLYGVCLNDWLWLLWKILLVSFLSGNSMQTYAVVVNIKFLSACTTFPSVLAKQIWCGSLILNFETFSIDNNEVLDFSELSHVQIFKSVMFQHIKLCCNTLYWPVYPELVLNVHPCLFCLCW